jgi:hypothetical protein
MALNTRSKAAARLVQQTEASWPSRPPVSLFVHILHLLDLDLLDDWPQITVNTFSTRTAHQNLQQRIRATEWSLFRLSEIHDPLTTRNKLQPFFPPQSQLQSQNLRAALLRVLTELKKTGMLRQDVVLRKTTFDECKGDKFEELISQFAHLTLRTSLERRKDPILELIQLELEHCLPLTLAYQVSLSKNIAFRQSIGNDVLVRKDSLSRRVHQARSQRAQLAKHKPLEGGIRASVRDSLKDSWTADPRWIDTLLYASPGSQPPNARTELAEHQKTLVDLVDMVDAQETRLRQWKALHSTVGEAAPQSSLPGLRIEHTGRPIFEEHRALRGREDKQPQRDAVISDFGLSPHVAAISDTTQNVPYTPKGGFRAPEDDGPSLEIQNVLRSQLKNSLSPLRRQDKHSVTTSPQRSYHSSPPETPSRLSDRQPSHGDQLALPSRPEGSGRQSSPAISQQGLERSEITEMQSGDLSDPPSDGALPPTDLEENCLRSDATTREQQRWSRMTLEARTRASMAGFFPEDTTVDSSPLKGREAETSDTISIKVAGHDAAGDENLMDRTRKSLSLLNLISDAKSTRRKSKGPRLSQLYPINPFETPRKPSLQPILQTPSSTSTTPREKLFSDEAEYSSVFKSRPKIAQSPMVSPDRSMLDDEDSFLAQKVQDLELR